VVLQETAENFVDETQDEWVLEQLGIKKELLRKVKSTKMSYYGHVVRKHNSLEKEVIQGCIPGSSTTKTTDR